MYCIDVFVMMIVIDVKVMVVMLVVILKVITKNNYDAFNNTFCLKTYLVKM
jgi:hypothetical protein